MQTVYLKDGRMADMVTKTDKGYLVDPYITWNDYEGQIESAPSGNVELVSDIFNTAPVEFIEAEYKKVLDKVEEQERILNEKHKEVNRLNSEVNQLRNQKTDLSRFIINKSELRDAKRLIAFVNKAIAPHVMDGTKHYKFTVSYEISQYAGELRAWIYKIHHENKDYGWSNGDYFDSEYGIKTDLTDEEIKQLTFERQAKKGIKHFCEGTIINTPDEWLTPEFIVEKKRLSENYKKTELKKAQEELQRAQDKVDKLINAESIAY